MSLKKGSKNINNAGLYGQKRSKNSLVINSFKRSFCILITKYLSISQSHPFVNNLHFETSFLSLTTQLICLLLLNHVTNWHWYDKCDIKLNLCGLDAAPHKFCSQFFLGRVRQFPYPAGSLKVFVESPRKPCDCLAFYFLWCGCVILF